MLKAPHVLVGRGEGRHPIFSCDSPLCRLSSPERAPPVTGQGRTGTYAMNENPIFIGGAHKSGTTLLQTC